MNECVGKKKEPFPEEEGSKPIKSELVVNFICRYLRP